MLSTCELSYETERRKKKKKKEKKNPLNPYLNAMFGS
jgi:hypothetical protein